jgi:hypothetical protein
MGLKYSAGIDKNPVYSVTGFDMFYCTKHITQNVHVHYKFRTYFCYLVELIIFKLINLSQRGLPQEVLCKTSSMLLCVLEQTRLDNSSAGPHKRGSY